MRLTIQSVVTTMSISELLQLLSLYACSAMDELSDQGRPLGLNQANHDPDVYNMLGKRVTN